MLYLKNAFAKLDVNRAMSYYAVANGRIVGIFESWKSCEEQVKGFKGAKYKKFNTRLEAEKYIKEAQGQGTSQFAPQHVAVPLGQQHRGAQLKWQQTSNVVENTNKGTEFWPECEEVKSLTDEELLKAASVIDNKIMPQANSGQRKRKSEHSEAIENGKVFKHCSKIWTPVDVRNIGEYQFQIDEEDFVIVYTDGSCVNNGKSTAYAGFGVYFADDHPLNAAKPVYGRATNNVGEIQAAIYAIKCALKAGIPKLCISTDSQFLLNAATMWITGWKQKDWRLKDGGKVKNATEFKELDLLLQNQELTVKWVCIVKENIF